MKTKLHFLVIAASLAVLVSACTPASETVLKGPAKPTTPTQPTTEPTGQTDSDGDGNGGGGTGGGGGGIGTTPTPTPVQRYRLLCDDRYPTYMTAVSSLAGPSGFGADLDIQVWPANVPLPTTGGFQTEDRTIEYHEHPQAIRFFAPSMIRLTFSGRPHTMLGGPLGEPRSVYLAEADMVGRVGRAEKVTSEMPASSDVQALAAKEGFATRTFSVSDGGKYLMVLDNRGVLFFDANTGKSLGHLSLQNPADRFAPTFRESDLIFTSSTIRNDAVTTELATVSFDASGSVRRLGTLNTVKGLRRPLVAVTGRAGDVFAAVKSSAVKSSAVGSLRVELAVVSPLGRGSASDEKSFAVSSLGAGGKVSSAAAFWRVQGELHTAVSYETVKRIGSGMFARYKVDAAAVRVFQLDESAISTSVVGTDFQFPIDAIQTIESGASSNRILGFKELSASPDGKAIFGLLPGSLSYYPYRLTGTGLTRVSQEDCTNLSIGVEP